MITTLNISKIRKDSFLICFSFLVFFFTVNLFATEPINFRIKYFEDKEKTFEAETFPLQEKFSEFKTLPNEPINFGFSKSKFWFLIESDEITDSIEYIYIDSLMMEKVNFYSETKSKTSVHFRSGWGYPFQERVISETRILFPIGHMKNNEHKQILLSIETNSPIIFRIKFLEETDYNQLLKEDAYMKGAYYGILTIMFFFNLLLLVLVKEVNYFYYLTYMLSLILHLSVLNGEFQYLIPNYPNLFFPMYRISSSCLLLSIIVLYRKMMNFNEKYNIEDSSMKLLLILAILNVPFILFSEKQTLFRYANLLALVYILFFIIVLIRPIKDLYSSAVYFLLTWIAFLLGSLIFVSRNLIIVPENIFTNYSIQLGSIFETLFLSLALSQKINDMKKKLSIANTELEIKIQERTEELSDRVKNLQKKDSNYELELKIASELQKCLVPHESKTYDLVKMVYRYNFMMQVGGDFFDLVSMKEDKLAIYIADASGHGVPAALLSMMYKSCINNSIAKYDFPIKIFQDVNKQIEVTMETYDYLTAALFIIEKSGKFVYSSAGHRPAFLLRKNNTEVEILFTKGMFLGMRFQSENFYEQKEDFLEPGDRLLLYTDGMVETSRPDKWGVEFLKDAFYRSKKMSLEIAVKFIESEWKRSFSGENYGDDSTILLIEFSPHT
ncbi:MAG: SpoIIE family protein phosphatase [Leptospiraceae bacterium]|nr:SpoIIE family protein phosphatase [Leptospiraceae bacterium]